MNNKNIYLYIYCDIVRLKSNRLKDITKLKNKNLKYKYKI